MEKIVLTNGSVAIKWEHPHGLMEEKVYLYKVEVDGQARLFPHEQTACILPEEKNESEIKVSS